MSKHASQPRAPDVSRIVEGPQPVQRRGLKRAMSRGIGVIYMRSNVGTSGCLEERYKGRPHTGESQPSIV